MVFVYAAAVAPDAVVTVAVMVQVPGVAIVPLGIVPPVKVTVRVGTPDNETTPPAQVVVGVPVYSRFEFGAVGRVSDIVLTVYA
jgi:hypothetical protein